MPNRAQLLRIALLAVLPLLILAGCDRHDDVEHAVMNRVIIESRGLVPESLAEWDRGSGWNVESLPTLTIGDADDNFGRASWTVRIFEGGQELELDCDEYEAQYSVSDSDIIYWNAGGTVTVGGTPRPIFHCDHIHIYPRAAGTTEVRIALWHVDHVDATTDPISITVEGQE